MKSAEKQSKNRIKKPRWRKIVVAAIVILGLIIGAFGIRAVSKSNENTARFAMSVSTPQPAIFEDNNAADFIGPNATPDINNNRTLGAPGELVILYEQTSGEYTPAIRMDLDDADLTKHIKITPAIAGTWRRNGPNAITFRPSNNWPADTKFTVQTNKSLFNPDIRINSMRASFTTPELTAIIDSFDTYPSHEKKSVIGVAVVSFNYPIITKQFSERVIMRLDGKQIDFTVRFDRFNRTALITTAPIQITDAPQTLRIKINKISASDGSCASAKVTAHTTIESADNIFRISNLETTVADDASGLPQQLVLIDTTSAAARDTKWNEYVDVYLLPEYSDEEDTDNTRPHKWAIDEITDTVIKKSKKLKTTIVNFENPNGVYKYALAYDVSEKDTRFIYISVRAGVPSASGFTMSHGATRVMTVPYPTRSVKIAGRGALLALGGERKLGITARGGADAAYINLYKVKSTEINHLISQTYNLFGNMDFKSWAFDAYDMAVVFKKRIGFADTSMKAVNYASVDLGDYLDRTNNDKTGIFIVQTGPSQSQADYSDRRLILLTNMGLVRKVNLDMSSTVFISELASGTPAADTEVYVLGRNGNAIWAGRTDNDGHAEIPPLPWNEYKNEKAPVAIVARRENDVSFIPYDNAYDNHVEYSKFDVDGTYAAATASMNAFLFTDRGVYRPGETATIGGIVKSKNFTPTTGIPVKLEMRNSRGRIVLEKIFSLESDGLFDVQYEIPSTAQTGEYNLQLYSLNAKNKPQDILGYAALRVEEFMPDTLKINANIPGTNDKGWMTGDNMTALVSLRNMFGTPATDKRITARLILTPATFDFKEYAGYKFTDNFVSGSGLAAISANKTITHEYDDIRTDSDGNAEIPLNIADEMAANVTYKMALIVHGFEGGSGRSVQTAINGRISNAKYLIGWHVNSDLKYINRGATRTVDLIAVDNMAQRTTATDLTMRLMRRENLTSLVKDGSGYYKYQTITRDKIISQNDFTITDNGMNVNLDTGTPGTYFLQILNQSGDILVNIEYFVAGDENTTIEADTQAELQIKLNAATYAPGDDIAVSITAPYSGYGLITIERDKVYAYKWFKANTTTSVQHITVPDGFEGTGYINVSFVRDINSRDIFTSPYAYAVAPFTADAAKRTIDIQLKTPEILAEKQLKIEYKTNQDSRIMIFAVNEGILQVARYQMPQPIAHFFRKAALQVETYQILSLILPEYKILREFAKTGGGDYDEADGGTNGMTNPFARATEAPVAFYSGIITSDANTPGTITFDIPDSFNGTLRVFAIAANESGAGSANAIVTVRHPVIITANAPLAVAPGDTFDVTAMITNLTDNETTSEFQIHADASTSLTPVTATTGEISVPMNTERMWSTTLRAGDTLGAANVRISANSDKFNAITNTTLSVRPATPFTTDIQMGILNSKQTNLRPAALNLYTDGAIHNLYISYGAESIVRPLIEYLNHYEWNCTEQLTSRTMPYAIIGTNEMLSIKHDMAAKKIADTINTLKTRQNDDGSFAMWASHNTDRNNESDTDTAYITAYVTWMLSLARANGFDVPRDMTGRALNYLRTYAGTNIRDIHDATTHAFAIYVITANEYVTTAYISQFEEWANTNWKEWESSLAGQYIAASYSIMRQTDRAMTLGSKYRHEDTSKYTSIFDNAVANNAIHQYLSVKYLGATTQMPDKQQMKYINSGEYSSFTSAMVILGNSANISHTNSVADAISVTADGTAIHTKSKSGAFIADIPANTKKISVTCPDCGTSVNMFWTITQQGYPQSVTKKSNGIEIVREYYDLSGNRITRAKIGDYIKVKIFIRAIGDVQNIPGAIIVDLMPGGMVADSATIAGNYDFAESREDRVIIYTDINRTASEYSYTAQATAAGTFTIPSAYATSMYNPAQQATGTGGTFTVINE